MLLRTRKEKKVSVKTVQATINGQTYTLTLNSTSGKYEATVTAPSKSSYNQSGHYYGVTVKATDVAGNITTKDAADATLGKSLRLQVKEKVPDGVFIFLTPPDLAELRGRLSGRGTDSLAVINERMEKAREEIKLMSEYDYAVVNDEVHLAVERVKKIVEAEHFRVDRVIGRYQNMVDMTTYASEDDVSEHCE